MKPALTVLIALSLLAHTGPVPTRTASAAAPSADARPAGEVKGGAAKLPRVLALYWYPSDHPVSTTFDQQFEAALKRQSNGTIVHYAEYFESSRFPGESQERIMRDFLREKYADRKI